MSKKMSNEDSLSDFVNHLMRGGSNVSPLIQEHGLSNVLNQFAEYCFSEYACSCFAGDREAADCWLLTEGLLRKAAELSLIKKTTEPPSDFHAEAINRFLFKLPSHERQALGSPPQLRVEVSIGIVSPSYAEESGGWYDKPWAKCFSEKLVITATNYEHCCALKLGLKAYVQAAKGLFRGLDFESGGHCQFGCAVVDQ